MPTGTMANQIALLVPLRDAVTKCWSARARTACSTSRARARPAAGVQLRRRRAAAGRSPPPNVRGRDQARRVPLSAHAAGGAREHAQPRRRARVPAGRRRSRSPAAHAARAARAPRRRAHLERRGRDRQRTPAKLAAPATRSAPASRRGSARRSGSVLCGSREARSRARTASARCWAAACARPACSRRRRCTRSITTSRGSPTTTRTRGCSPNGCAGAAAASPATCAASRPTSSISTCPARDAERFAREAARCGVRVNAIAPERLRAVTHLDVTRAGIELARRTARRSGSRARARIPERAEPTPKCAGGGARSSACPPRSLKSLLRSRALRRVRGGRRCRLRHRQR